MMGFDKLMWFMGVVEDNRDPTMNGRVRIRAFNVHPPNKEDVPTAHLPWATVLDGSYGVSQSIPREGDWVFGFFIDGPEANHPMIIGKLPGVDHSFPAGTGEPGEDPYIPPESIQRFGQPPFNRYVSGEDCEDSQSPLQNAAQVSGIKTAYKKPGSDDEYIKFNEPPILAPEHNYNTRVLQSKEGNNAVVLTDNEDGEGTSILITHSSGSVVQIDGHGTIFIKSFGDTYNSSEGFEFNRIDKDSHTNVGGDWSLKIEKGSGRIEVEGDLDIECNNFNVQARASINLDAGSAINMSGTKIGGFATQDDINFLAYNQIKMGTVNLNGNIVMKAPFGDFNVVSYSTNMISESYTAISSIGVPDILNLYPRVATQGIDIMCPTHVTLSSGLGTLPGIVSGYVGLLGPDVASLASAATPPKASLRLDTIGSATLTADTFIKTQALLTTDMLSGLSTTITSGLSNTLVSGTTFNATAGVSADMIGGVSTGISGGVSAKVFGGASTNVTGGASATLFGGATASVTGGASASIFGGGAARMTGGGTASVTAGGVAFLSGSTTLVGMGGPSASPGTPATPSVPAVPGLPPIPIIPVPAWHNVAEKVAVATPPEIEPIRPFIGIKGDNTRGIPKPVPITSRSSK